MRMRRNWRGTKTPVDASSGRCTGNVVARAASALQATASRAAQGWAASSAQEWMRPAHGPRFRTSSDVLHGMPPCRAGQCGVIAITVCMLGVPVQVRSSIRFRNESERLRRKSVFMIWTCPSTFCDQAHDTHSRIPDTSPKSGGVRAPHAAAVAPLQVSGARVHTQPAAPRRLPPRR